MKAAGRIVSLSLLSLAFLPGTGHAEEKHRGGEEDQAALAARLVRVLTDPRSSLKALREAAEELALNAGSPWPYQLKDSEPNPALLKIKNPSLAEAILAALDRDLAHNAGLAKQQKADRAHLECTYFCALIRVGDKRIAGELTKRAEREASASMRLQWAYAGYRLGKADSLRRFAEEFGAGKIALAKDTADWDLAMMVEYLSAVPLPEADEALFALADAKHPYHAAIAKDLVQRREMSGSGWTYLRHPFCVSMLRGILEDKTPTRIVVTFQETRVQRQTPA